MENWILWVWVIQTVLGFYFWRNFNLRDRRVLEGWFYDLVVSAFIIPNLFMFLLFVHISVSEFFPRKKNKNRRKYV